MPSLQAARGKASLLSPVTRKTSLDKTRLQTWPGIGTKVGGYVLVMTISDIKSTENKAVNTLPYKLNVMDMAEALCRDSQSQDFPGGTVVKNLPSSAGHSGSIPGQGTKTPHAAGQ